MSSHTFIFYDTEIKEYLQKIGYKIFKEFEPSMWESRRGLYCRLNEQDEWHYAYSVFENDIKKKLFNL